MDEYPVCYENTAIGTMRLTRENNWTKVEVRCGKWEEGICRAFLLCRQGELPLGVLEPVGEELRLCRRVPGREIESRGGVERVEVRLSYAFGERWQRLSGRFFQKGGICENWEEAFWRREGEMRLLALPYEPGRPFSLVPLFCFARIMPVCRRCCAVFCFDGEERPVMVEKDGCDP